MWIAVIQMLFLSQVAPYDEGMKALEAKQYDAAVAQFSKAVAAEPDNYAAHFNLGLAFTFSNHDAQAIPEFQKTLELQPKLYQAELNLGMVLLRDHQAAQAAPYLTEAASQKPREYRPNLYAGEALLGAGDATQAKPFYEAALASDPKSAAAEVGLGRVFLKLGDLENAATHLRKAAAASAEYRSNLLELAVAYEQQKQTEKAAEIYRQFPDDTGAQEHLAQLTLDQGGTAEAIPLLEAAVAKSPTTANRAELAALYLKSNQPAKALPLATAALAAEPQNFELRMLHGRVLRDSRQFPAAAQDFYQATQMKPEEPMPWSELAAVLVMAENYPAALGALDKVAQLKAEKPGHVYLRALIFDKVRQLKPALENYRRFLALSTGQNPDEEFKARQRARILDQELHHR